MMMILRSSLLFAWMAGGAGWLSATAHADAAFQIGVGVHVGQNRNALAATEKALAQLDATSFRDEVFWHRLETKQGMLAWPDSLKDLDQLVTDTARQGRRPLLILDYGNKLYDAGGQVHSPEGIAAFVRYVRFVVQHFRGRVEQFEIWNEWNIGSGGTADQRAARYGNPQQYAALLRAAYTAIKVENPSATVIGGAFAGYDYGWVDAFGHAGGFNSLDGFSIHPYVFSEGKPAPQPPNALQITTGVALLQGWLSLSAPAALADTPLHAAPGTPESAMHHLDDLKSHIDALAPGRTVRVYITEAGWPVNKGTRGVSEETAAAYLQRFMLLARSRPWIAGVWWYDLFDDGDDAQNKEHRFGLMTRAGMPRPAFQALIDIKPLLTSPTPPRVETDSNGHITVSGQRADGKGFSASWPAASEERMQVKEP